jgi:MFS family permease
MYGVFQTFYQLNDLKTHSASAISWIGSLQAFLLFLGSAVTGPFFDMGYLRTLLCLGTFLVSFGMVMTSLCQTYWQVFLAQGLTVGLGFGCLFLPSVAIVSQYFTTKKSFAFGVASTGSSIGMYLITSQAPFVSDLEL